MQNTQTEKQQHSSLLFPVLFQATADIESVQGGQLSWGWEESLTKVWGNSEGVLEGADSRDSQRQLGSPSSDIRCHSRFDSLGSGWCQPTRL